MKERHILNLGAGVQSTTLYLMDANGELLDLEDGPVKFDVAIFADTQEEPSTVYDHLAWLAEVPGGCPILTGTAGKIGDDLMKGVNGTGQRFATIPAYTSVKGSGVVGKTRRQCTSEYKISVVERIIRRKVLGLEPRKRIPKDVELYQYMGFSFDEPGRAANARQRFLERGWSKVRFPLFEEMMSRHDCRNYLEKRVPHRVPRSACVFCPYKSNLEWRELKANDPNGWARAVEVDEGMRKPGAICNRGLEADLYIHRSCKPLKDCSLDASQGEFDFQAECEGGCGL